MYKVNDTQDKSSDIGLINNCVFVYTKQGCQMGFEGMSEARVSEGCRKSVGGISEGSRKGVGRISEGCSSGTLRLY